MIKLNDLEEAKNTFDKVIEIDQNYSKAYFHKARILTHPDDFEAAKSNYETALDIDEKFEEAHYYLGKLLMGGVATDKEGTIVDKTNLPEAKKHFSLALKVKTQKLQSTLQLGPSPYSRGKLFKS